jgi:hypothetical protein
MTALQAAIEKREQIDAEIAALAERKEALETLIRAAYPHKGRLVLDQNPSIFSVLNNLQGSPGCHKLTKTLRESLRECPRTKHIHEGYNLAALLASFCF